MMKAERFITVAILLTCVLFTFSLANISNADTSKHEELYGSNYKTIAYEQTGLDVEGCGFHACLYPSGGITQCSSDAGPVYITHYMGNVTARVGEPYEPTIEIIKTASK